MFGANLRGSRQFPQPLLRLQDEAENRSRHRWPRTGFAHNPPSSPFIANEGHFDAVFGQKYAGAAFALFKQAQQQVNFVEVRQLRCLEPPLGGVFDRTFGGWSEIGHRAKRVRAGGKGKS